MKPAQVAPTLLTFFAAFCFCATRTSGATNSVSLGGWADVDITPALGIALGGRGGPITAATTILDPLHAQLLFLKDPKGTGFVLVSFDLIGLPHELSDRIRTDIVHELGVAWNLIVLNASHTHSGPYMIRNLIAGVGPPPQIEIDYFKALEEKIIQAARSAARNMKPVKLEVFEGSSRLAINRRGKNKQGKLGILPDPDGPFDERLWVLKATPIDGQPPAVVFSYACHPVIVYGFALSAISADFPGAARKALGAALGSEAHLQFLQGFAGNVRPRIVADLEKGIFRASKPTDLEAVGAQLADAILAALKQKGDALSLNLAGAADRPIPSRGEAPPRDFYVKMREQAIAETNRFRIGVSDYWLQRYDLGHGFARGDAWSLGLIRLSENQWIVHSAGEPCVEWRPRISQWLAGLNIVCFGYSQEARSYLPVESMLSEGGYEVLESNETRASTPAAYAPGIEQAIHDSLLRQLAFIRSEKN